jgi:hypothetical protein
MKRHTTSETITNSGYTPLYIVRSNHSLKFIRNEHTKGLRQRFFEHRDHPASKNLPFLILKTIPWVILLLAIAFW